MPLAPALLEQTATQRVAPLKVLEGEGQVLVHEIYASIQGESTHAGRPCAFIRLTGCHLRCTYCDTAHAFFEGQRKTVPEVVEAVRALNLPLVELTGGEPLLQRGARPLISALCDAGLEVLVESSGALSIQGVDPRARVILDVKTPGSGEADRNVWSNLDVLWAGCEIKFVICDEADFEWALKKAQEHDLFQKAPVLFSPEAEQMDARWLADAVHRRAPQGRFQLQLHRILWGDARGV
jgi:7-carboxy-7-deazaguanine synthase